MTGEQKAWGPWIMKEKEKKKYQVALRMLDEGLVELFNDIAPDDITYNGKDIHKVVDDNDTIALLGNYVPPTQKWRIQLLLVVIESDSFRLTHWLLLFLNRIGCGSIWMQVIILPFFHHLTSAMHGTFVIHEDTPLPGTTGSP